MFNVAWRKALLTPSTRFRGNGFVGRTDGVGFGGEGRADAELYLRFVLA